MDLPVVLCRRPAVHRVLNAAAAVGREAHGGGRILQNVLRVRQGLPAGGFYGLGRRVVGGGKPPGDPPPPQSGVVGHLGIRQGLVGQHHQQAVGRHQLGVVQGDLLHRPSGAGSLDIIPDGKGVGGEDHQAAGHVGQHILRRQRDPQGGHGQQRHQRGHVNAQAADYYDGGQQVQHQPDAGQQVLPHPVIQLGGGQKAAGHLHQQPDDHQADHHHGQGGQDVSHGYLPHRGGQHTRQIDVSHRASSSLRRRRHPGGGVPWPAVPAAPDLHRRR